MAHPVPLERFTRELFDLLDETFEKVQGMYLDKGTSLFETLEHVTAEEASHRTSDRCATIAAHVKHVSFYLKVLQENMLQKKIGKVDWKEIWRATGPVTPEEWKEIRGELKATHSSVVAMLRGFDDWEGKQDISGAMSIVAHTAYHLGAIRQILCVARSR